MHSNGSRSGAGDFLVAAAVVAFAGLWLVGRAESQAPRPTAAGGFLSVLQPHQPLAIAESGGGFELSLMPGPALLTYEVVEVGTDFVAVRNTANITAIRIPIYSIKSIMAVQTPKP